MAMKLVQFQAALFVRTTVFAVLLGAALVPGPTFAAHDFPDFYGTVVAADRNAGTVTVAPDAPGKPGGLVTVDVRDLGRKPWDEGAFRLNQIVVLRTRRVGDRHVAIGWEQARDGSERFEGVEPRRRNKEED